MAFIAGFINVIGLLGFEHQPITHLTGSASMLGSAIGRLNAPKAVHFLFAIGSFMAGCVLSGLLIQSSSLRLGRRYGIALFIESLLLFASIPLFQVSHEGAIYLAAGACGLQNAMATTYSGTVVRTTHLSGMFTDLGISLGHLLRGQPLDLPRLKLSGIIISGFVVGGAAGAAGFDIWSYSILLVPAAMTLIGSLGYAVYLWRRPDDL